MTGNARQIRAADVLWMALLTVAGAALRLHGIGTSLWYDEIVTLLESVRAPLVDIVTSFAGDNHHPLYSVLAHVAVTVFGEEPWALRLPAALFGAATLPLLYRLGREVTTPVESVGAALILMVSYHHVWFSQNARGYTAVLFFVVLSTYALLRWLDGGGRRFGVLFVAATALGAYAHMTTVLVAVGQAAALAIAWLAGDRSAARRPPWLQAAALFTGAALLTVCFYAPMLLDVGAVMASGASSGGEQASLVWTIGAVLEGLQVGFGTLWVIGLGGMVFGAGVVAYLRQRPLVALLFVLPVVVTAAAAVILGRPVRPRFLFFSAGFALLFVVRGAAVTAGIAARLLARAGSEPRWRAAGAGLLTLAAVALSVRSLPYGYRYPKQDYAAAVAFVERSRQPADATAVIGDTAEIPIARYLGRRWPRVRNPSELQAVKPAGGAVWVVSSFASQIKSGQPELWAALQRDCRPVHDVEGTVEDGTITIRRCF